MNAQPLAGVKVVEFTSLGPVEHAGMLLADQGAEVVLLSRDSQAQRLTNPVLRGRRFVLLDLKTDEGKDAAQAELADADVLIEGFRPGVMERLGFGPRDIHAFNPGLIYGRMTGWGQEGPLAQKAGHDINYLAITGLLAAIGTVGARPTAPLNFAGDNGGGSVYLVMGVLAALLARERTGTGCVIDAAIVDGSSSLLQTVRGLEAEGSWIDAPASNLFDTGAPFYDTYECADGRYMAVGAIEPKFFAELIAGLDLPHKWIELQYDRVHWSELRHALSSAFLREDQNRWIDHFESRDACVSPVLTMTEAVANEHLRARGTLAPGAGGVWAAAPAPRLRYITSKPSI